ncbi:hypothetical protein PHLGIDRAFT_15939, partial [Phlebiopsis gigantea 11061_1 CR5-6]
MYLRQSLIALAAALMVSAATNNPRWARIQECRANNVVSTRTIQSGEDVVEIRTVSCPGIRSLFPARNGTSIFNNCRTLSGRSASECTKPAECQCGLTCSGECETNGETPPLVSDCQKLTTLFSSGAPSSFFLGPDEFSEAPLGTCEYVVFNLRETEIEFCNDDWVRDYALSLSNTANKFIQVGRPADVTISRYTSSGIVVYTQLRSGWNTAYKPMRTYRVHWCLDLQTFAGIARVMYFRSPFPTLTLLASASVISMKTQTLQSGEHTIELKTASCPGLKPLTSTENRAVLPQAGTLSRRSSLECSKPAECQCGKQCNGGCATTGDPAPVEDDCLQLAVQLLAIPTPTNFFIESGQVASATMGTCTFAAVNLISSEIEYCIDDFANAAFQLSAL